MVTVKMRVDQEPHRIVTDAGNFGNDPLGQRRELAIDEKDAVVADEYADVAPCARQHVHATRNRRQSKLDGIVVDWEPRALEQPRSRDVILG